MSSSPCKHCGAETRRYPCDVCGFTGRENVRAATAAEERENLRHELYRVVAGRMFVTLDDAHDLAMGAKEVIFRAQDAVSLAWQREPENRRTLNKIEKRLARVRAELEALDRDVLADSYAKASRAQREGRR